MDDGDYPITSLVDAAAAGDELAWHEILDRYVPLLASVIRRLRLTTVSDGAARLGCGAPRDLDRPRERRWT